ncbi:hypothetical protein GCM10010412_055100 [Nonomuraea recticatena]|uniref:Uncharacterized protein n=1 Tax=Nonomuraea recticatena TaxID=46178 RepID=A0ABP6ERQ4_9ACTN
MAALWGEPAAPAAAISEMAPHAARRRVVLSWSVRVMDMVVCSFVSDIQWNAVLLVPGARVTQVGSPEWISPALRAPSLNRSWRQLSPTALIPGRRRPDTVADATPHQA